MTRPWIFDGCCKAGGAGSGYAHAGFNVLGVDIEPQPNNPHDFIQGDVIDVLERLLAGEEIANEHSSWSLREFAGFHASPPCPRYSNISKSWNGNPDAHPDLIADVRELLRATGRPYVIENVPDAPLENPIQLCGSSFGLGVRRHRLFECSFPVMANPCAHGQQEAKYDVYEHGRWFKSSVARVYGLGGGKAKDQWAEAMGIDWMSDKELAQAIPPAFTEHIGGYLMAALGAKEAA